MPRRRRVRGDRAGGDRSALVLAGAFAGFAASTKLFGLLSLAALVAVVLVVIVIDRRRPVLLVAAVVVTLVAGAPWYARTWAVAGHPFWPFVVVEGAPSAGRIVEDLARRVDGHRAAAGNIVVRLPAAIVGHPDVHGRAPIGPLVAAGLLLLTVVGGARRTWPWLAWSAAYAVGWYVLAPYARYLLPAFVAWSAAGGSALAAARSLGPLSRHAVAAATLGWGVASLVAGGSQLARVAPVVTSIESRDAFLARVASHHADIVWMNRTLPARAVVASVYPGLAYLERRAIWLEDLQAFVDVDTAASIDALRASLAAWGASHLFLVDDPGDPAPPDSRRRLAELAARCGVVVHDNPASVAIASVFLAETERLRARVVELRSRCE